MQIVLGILIGLMIVDLVLVAAWTTVRLYYTAQTVSPAEIAPFFVAAGVLLALITLLLNRKRDASKDYLESATDLIEKSYNVLNDPDEHGRPKNSRINWLTSARLLRKAQRIAKLISEQSHRGIWEEKQEYWRGRFHDLISPTETGFPREYYAEKTEHLYGWSGDVREPLAPRSLAVLYRFIRWPKDQEDPMKDEPWFTKKEIENMVFFGPTGLGELLEDFEELRKKSKDA